MPNIPDRFSQLPDLTCRQLLEALPASRRKRIQGLSHPAAIAQSVAVSALLYEALDEADGSVEGGCVIIPAAQLTAGRLEPLTKRYLLDWTPSPSGQPFPGGIAAGLGGRSSGLLYTSLSHSGVWAAAAIARCPVGLDIQSPDPLPDHRLLRIGARFHPQETAGLEQLTPAERQSAFYRLWTMKESVMKLCGAGFFSAFALLLYFPGSIGGLYCSAVRRQTGGTVAAEDGGTVSRRRLLEYVSRSVRMVFAVSLLANLRRGVL